MILLSSILAAALVFSADDAQLALGAAQGLVDECTPRDAGTIRGRIAANHILDKASAAGADVRRDIFKAMTPRGEREFVNLYAEFRTSETNSRWVVLVSHYDTKPGTNCPGANDGASTSGLLIGLANAVSNWQDRHGNLMLIWADGEECMDSYAENDGLWGSRRAAQMVADRGLKIQAVICLDMLGDRNLAISIPSNGASTLAKIAIHCARRIGYPDLVRSVDEIVKDDHVPFLDRGYKAIDLIDFNYGPNNSYWHTSEDSMKNISVESLQKSGSLVADMLNILL